MDGWMDAWMDRWTTKGESKGREEGEGGILVESERWVGGELGRGQNA